MHSSEQLLSPLHSSISAFKYVDMNIIYLFVFAALSIKACNGNIIFKINQIMIHTYVYVNMFAHLNMYIWTHQYIHLLPFDILHNKSRYKNQEC